MCSSQSKSSNPEAHRNNEKSHPFWKSWCFNGEPVLRVVLAKPRTTWPISNEAITSLRKSLKSINVPDLKLNLMRTCCGCSSNLAIWKKRWMQYIGNTLTVSFFLFTHSLSCVCSYKDTLEKFSLHLTWQTVSDDTSHWYSSKTSSPFGIHLQWR